MIAQSMTPKPITDAQVKAMIRLLDDITKENPNPSDYVKARQDAVRQVESELRSGKLELSKAPELAERAISERASLVAYRSSVEAQKKKLKLELASAEQRVGAAELEARKLREELAKARGELQALLSMPEPEADLGGWRKRWRRWRRHWFRPIRKTWDDLTDEAKRLRDPVRYVRDDLAKTFLPKAVRRFGRQIEAETNRLGARVNKELLRGMANVAKYGDWIRAFSVVLRWSLPFGVIFQLVTIAVVSAIEIAQAQRQKRQLDDELSKLQRIVSNEVAKINERTAELKKEAARLRMLIEAEKKAAQVERNRRLEAAKGVMVSLEEARIKNTSMAAGSGVVAGLGAITALDGKLVPGAALATVGVAGMVAAYRRSKKAASQLESYYTCIDSGRGDEECRTEWAKARAGLGGVVL